jgi:LCP family protein required for cell wall assembly
MRRLLLVLTSSLSALVMVAAVIGIGAYKWTQGQIRTIPEPVVSVGPNGTPSPQPPGIVEKCAQQACNYLLLGSDSRQGLSKQEQIEFGTNQDIGGENRSDTIILVHTKPGEKKATFVSFPRDLWVDIPGVGMDKINAAFDGGINGGGAQLVARTVTHLTGLPIHHVMYVSLAGFQGVVDALGGVDMCVPYPMQDILTGLDIPAGCQHFDGKTALAYVRTRHQPCDAVPDFARIGRQQQFLRAVIAKLLQPSELVHLPSLVPALLKNIVVDKGLNPAELAYLAGTLQGVGTDAVDFRSVPSVPAGIYDPGYLSIVKEVQPQANQLFRKLRNDQPLGNLGLELPGVAPSPANIPVVVVNANAGSIAAQAFNNLTDGGFNTSGGILDASAVQAPQKGSMILYRTGKEAEAKVVGGYFPNLALVPAPAHTLANGQDVAVIVTGRYQFPPPAANQPVDCSATA